MGSFFKITMTDHPLQNEQLLDRQTNLAQVKMDGVDAQSTAGEVGSEPKRGLAEHLGERLFLYCNMVGDLLFRALVQLHPTKALCRFKQDAKQVRRSGLFDSEWYRENYKKKVRPSQNPIHHYLTDGAALGFDPNPSFDTPGYLKLHPDVAASQLNPLLHLLRSGKRMKRILSMASCAAAVDMAMRQYAPQLARLQPSKKTILLVSHEMSRTGAPILVLNIAKCLREQYNIIILTLKDGCLEREYVETCDVLIGPKIPSEHLRSEMFFALLLQRITSETPITFAIVNTIVSHVVIKPLWECNIPSIHLIHEFASYTRPVEVFAQSAIYASLPIFSAAIVRANAIEKCPDIEHRSILLPQGINGAPGLTNDPQQAAAERQRMIDTLRPSGFPKDTVVVLGIGSIHIRKGLDLFVACAKRVAEKCPTAPFRFVWIGDGYNPECNEYSMFIADQIHRSGLDHVLAIAKETAEIATAHQQSDIFLLSSRLDPLPQVAQDAMAHGRPVVCFRYATGIAEYLEEDPCAAYGVVPYLDIEETANRICRLIDDAPYRKEIGAASQKLALTRFCFESYVSRLQEIGLDLAARKEIEKADLELILKSNLFSPDFYCSPSHRYTSEKPLRQYMESWRSGILPRKPFPGFHPGIYAETKDVKDRDPLAHYLEAGQPEGPWRYEVIEDDGALAIVTSLSVGLHLHLYFPDLAKGIFERLQQVQTRMDLLISVPSAEVACQIESMVAQSAQGKLDIRVVPNLGRDIGPFLTGFGADILERYDIIGHLHVKKSVHLNDQAFVKNWADFLYENLLGGKKRMADTIFSRMAADPTIGLVFPDDPNVLGWVGNWDQAVALAERLNIARSSLKAAFNFPMGTMFWARTAALRPLFELGLQWADYPPEPLPGDGSSLHAIERMLPLVVEQAGFRSVATHVDGVTR